MARRADTERGERLLREELLLAQSAAGTVLEESLQNPVYLIDVYRSTPPGRGRGRDIWPASAEVLLESLETDERLCVVLDLDDETLVALAASAPEAVARIGAALSGGRLELTGCGCSRGLLTLPGAESILRRLALSVAAARQNIGIDADSCLLHADQLFPQLPQILAGFGFRQVIVVGGNGTRGSPAIRLRGPNGSELSVAFAAAERAGPSGYSDPLSWSNEHLEALRETSAPAAPLVCRLSDVASWDGPVAARSAVAARDDVRFVTPGRYFAATTPETTQLARGVVEEDASWGADAMWDRRAAQAEKTLLLAESLDAVAFAMGRDSDESEIEQAWHALLYPESAAKGDGAGIALEAGRALAEASAGFLASYVDSSGVEGRGLVVFNPSSWARDEYMEITLGGEGHRISHGGREVPSQVVDRRGGYVTLGFVTHVPALGYRLLEVRPSTVHDVSPAVASPPASRSFANEFYSAEIGEKGGVSIATADGRLVDAAGNVTLWRNGRFHDSRERAKSPEADQQGPVLERYLVEGSLAGMRFRQWTTLYRALPRIDLRTEIDFRQGLVLGTQPRDGMPDDEWRRGLLLELRAPAGGHLFAGSPFYTGNASGDRAVAFGLAGIDDERERGVAVLNRDRCAYRFDAAEGVLRAVLAHPSPEAKLSRTCVWECGLLPFASRLKALRATLDYQLPCLGVFVTPHAGSLPPEGSFLSVEPEEAMLSAMFVRQGKVYVRLLNASAGNIQANVGSGGPLSLWRCSLGLVDEARMEDAVPLRPWGVQTLRLSAAGER